MAAKKSEVDGATKAIDHPGSWSDHPERAARSAAALNALETQKPKVETAISLPKLDIRTLELTLIGDSALICHHWSEKAIKQMLDKQMGIPSAGREHKDPQKDFQESLYPHPEGGYGFPSIAFKKAAVEACTSLGKTVTKVAARQAFHVVGELVKIKGTPRMRQDMVTVGREAADIRFRGEFPDWEVTLQVRFNARLLSAEQVINLFNTAGFAVGVGEWRSERDGQFGLFHVK